MYNGIGLTTPRGSGTNGYVIRNLSTLRPHEKDRQSNSWDVAPPKHREPDQAILEHERKRGVEVKCLELQLQLEDDGVDEDDIEQRVDALRQKLVKQLDSFTPPSKALAASDTHGIAVAKKAELDKMARALGTRRNYVEGEAFDREKQEEMKQHRAIEREERDRARDEERSRLAEQRAKWEADKKERDRLRRRAEDQARKAREERAAGMPSPPPRAPRDYRRSRSPAPRRSRSPARRGPPPRRGRSHSRSQSPPSRRRCDSVSMSPPPRHAGRRLSRSRSRSMDSRSPPPNRSRVIASVSPPARRRSPSPAARPGRRFESRSPPGRSRRSPSPRRTRSRSRSVQSGSSMSVSSAGSKHRSR